MAQIAGEAAIKDQTWLTEVVRKVEAGRQRIAAIAAENGLDALPSATNFVAVDCGIDGAFALKVLQNLLARGVFIRKPMVAGLDRCVRISVGLDHELDILAEELPKALAAARAG
jgi:histidinol-phosphate aminotransferase